ncbi:MAG: outer membrane beta-barrel protein [Bacteroidia bacterium]
MKKFFTLAILALFITNTGTAQDDATPKKFRAGLKFIAEPGWYSSGNTNTSKYKSGFGYGFGLVLDFRLSDVIYFSTGIGGDFENGSVKYRNDGYAPVSGNNQFACHYTLDNSSTFVEAANGKNITEFTKSGNGEYTLNTRKIKTTYVTIPISLKMLTKEFSGFKYFGQFGGELGIRTGIKADDDYTYRYGLDNGVVTTSGTNGGLNLSKDASLVPLRVGLNVGLGTEYRIAGSTCLFLSVNYFHSFTNLMRNDSKFIYTGATSDSNNNITFTHLSQQLLYSSIRINIGVMF